MPGMPEFGVMAAAALLAAMAAVSAMADAYAAGRLIALIMAMAGAG